MTNTRLNRRQVLQATAAISATAALPLAAADSPTTSLKGRLYKTLKIGMVGLKGGTLTDKFKLAKAAGFGAIEISCPGANVADTKKAIADSGLPVDGSVGNTHWQVRHTHEDAAVRGKALEHLQRSLIETEAVGGKTCLLVVGHGNDGPEEEIWKRSVDNIALALPLAGELGVSIVVENVWNQFCYNHGGDHKQTADKFVKYIDDFNSPLVGMQFDIGN
ncbi:MAG: sugar phosphate isomerase/epimerase, partial [Planctomycetaceae bacterium]|nr:sugar phosphate isomerase/epimerase [Planctomycetaceae bacterium]